MSQAHALRGMHPELGPDLHRDSYQLYQCYHSGAWRAPATQGLPKRTRGLFLFLRFSSHCPFVRRRTTNGGHLAPRKVPEYCYYHSWGYIGWCNISSNHSRDRLQVYWLTFLAPQLKLIHCRRDIWSTQG